MKTKEAQTKIKLNNKATKFFSGTDIERCFVFNKFHFLFVLGFHESNVEDKYNVWLLSNGSQDPIRIYASESKPEWSLSEFLKKISFKKGEWKGEETVIIHYKHATLWFIKDGVWRE